MKKYMPLEGLRWSRDSGSTLCDTPQNGRSRTGWGGTASFQTVSPSLFFFNRFVEDENQPLFFHATTLM